MIGKHLETEDTIAAVATPLGRAALGMIRISGSGCIDLMPTIFLPKKGNEIIPFRPTLGKVLLDSGRFVDEAMLLYFQKPHSYTREDIAEITCHGSPVILDRVLSRILSTGVRLARPGEFTYRAFLNGRLDLVQASAVNDLISADTVYQAELALQQLEGRLSQKFAELRQKFLRLISLMEGNIDFSEEQHYNFITREEALRRHDDLISDLLGLLGTFERGRLIKEGFVVAIVGKPNVGKSSLFNAILGQNRAIVTPIPGTTRDYLQERISLGNYLVHLVDTAGIREAAEQVEEEGVRRSLQVIDNADFIVLVLDGTAAFSAEDEVLWKQVKQKDHVVVASKCDLPGFEGKCVNGEMTLAVSALTAQGVNELLSRILTEIERRVRFRSEDSLISNLRHKEILIGTVEAVRQARQAVESGMSEEFSLTDLHEALSQIGQITGEVTLDDIYQEIFSNFCIGK